LKLFAALVMRRQPA